MAFEGEFIAELPASQEEWGWQTTRVPIIENEIEKKKLFGIELAKNHPNVFEAALAALENNTTHALWAANNWQNDTIVIASRDLYANTLGVKSKLLDKEQLALKLLNVAEEKLHGRYLVEAKDRLKALELYCKLQGFLNDTPVSTNNNLTEIKIVLVKPQKEETKTIDVVPTNIEPISPVSIKLVKSA